jgi:putative membrane protein
MTMIRLLVSTLIQLAANAVGLLLATLVLDGMTISWGAFLLAVVFFTVVEVVLGPLIRQMAVKKANALLGSTALVVTLLGLLVTNLVSDGLSIEGLSTWVLATIIVWLTSLLATILLPIVLVKRKVEERRATTTG